jgi:pimeloyl-ACP methyl ester carboxylesterase
MDAYILLHGKHSGPDWGEDCDLFKLNENLKSKALTDFSTYPFGVYRVEDKFYHKPFQSVVEQIDSIIDSLKIQGASRIFLVGHSMGGNAILYYLSQRKETVDGVVLLAPAHNIHLPIFSRLNRWSVQHAKELIEQGKGEMEAHFVDYNSEGDVEVIPCQPINYLSMMDPMGPANMALTATNLAWPANILVISGDKDPTQPRFFETVYLNLKNKSAKSAYKLVPGNHESVCFEQYNTIQDWINTL